MKKLNSDINVPNKSYSKQTEAEKNRRISKLSSSCIYGTDANPRMARTSKMNMIMHGDGHGGVHHHDGLINVNGIFENRFDVILTNPPFGARIEKDYKLYGTKILNLKTQEIGLLICLWENKFADKTVDFATCVDKNGKRYNIELDNIRGFEDDFKK